MRKILVLSLVAAAMLTAIPVLAIVSGVGAPANRGPPETVQCNFVHPESLPAEASTIAQDALDARASHCPPTVGPPSDPGPPATIPCTFDHPEELPGVAPSTAQDALDARATHCPPTAP